jgi:hypothetical protein
MRGRIQVVDAKRARGDHSASSARGAPGRDPADERLRALAKLNPLPAAWTALTGEQGNTPLRFGRL